MKIVLWIGALVVLILGSDFLTLKIAQAHTQPDYAGMEHHKIGEFDYIFVYTQDSLGEIAFPPDDSYGPRFLKLPKDSQQKEFSLQHEIIHACLHNHKHSFHSKKELDDHLGMKWDFQDEENLATALGICLAESDIR